MSSDARLLSYELQPAGNSQCIPSCPVLSYDNLCTSLLPLSSEAGQAVVVGGEGDLGTLGEEESVTRHGLDLLASLVGDVHVALDNNLHLVVSVLVHKGSTCNQAVRVLIESAFLASLPFSSL